MSRAKFESVISEFPYQADIRRFGDDSAWPGNYRDIGVDLAWHMWLAGRESMRDEAVAKCKNEADNAGMDKSYESGCQSCVVCIEEIET